MTNSALDISLARTIAEAHMPQTMEVIGRGERIPDGMGGFRLAEGAVRATYPCRMSGVSGSEAVIAEQVQAVVEGKVRLPHDAQVRATDRVRIDGKNYEVVAVVPRAEAYAAQRVILVSGVS